MMSKLARERNRSRVGWSLLAIAAWIGAEIAVLFLYGFIYAIGEAQWGWPERQPGGILFLIYVLALCAGILGASAIRRVLRLMPVEQVTIAPPPPPPQFH